MVNSNDYNQNSQNAENRQETKLTEFHLCLSRNLEMKLNRPHNFANGERLVM